jgi:hypothetical protein
VEEEGQLVGEMGGKRGRGYLFGVALGLVGGIFGSHEG